MFFNFSNKNLNKKGFATIFVVILVLAIMSGIGIALLNFVLGEQKILRNEVKSLQAYYSAEAGAEDVLLRLKKAMDWTTPYLLDVGSSSVTVDVSDIVGGTRVINSVGNVSGRVRKVQIVYAISSDLISFHYGAQVGDGGMVMGNGSKVIGNVYSNGNVTGGGTITNSVIVAGNGNKIQGIDVGEDATVHTCESADITGTLYYVSGGSHGSCSYGAAVDIGPNEIESIPLPISLAQINEWKADALAGGTIADNVVINGSQIMGPIQIGTPVAPKNLTIGNGDTLKLYGTIYVTGDIVLSQNSAVLLENSYGSLSGIIIADGTIMVENGTQLNGSGQPGSYILILSTKNDIVNPVIDVRNNAAGAIFYTSSGLIFLKNNMEAREVTGYKIQLENNAEIQYESGLESAVFSEGPGGSWEIADWKETE